MPSTLARLRRQRILDRARHRRDGGLVQHVVAALHDFVREIDVGEVPFEELDTFYVIEIAALAGDQGVGNAHAVAAPDQFFGKMRADEAGAAGHEVMSHAPYLSNIGTGLSAGGAGSRFAGSRFGANAEGSWNGRERTASASGTERRGPASEASEGVRGKRREAPIFPRKIKVPPQRAVSRILSAVVSPSALSSARRGSGATIIPLAPSLLTGSSGLPGSLGRAVR